MALLKSLAIFILAGLFVRLGRTKQPKKEGDRCIGARIIWCCCTLQTAGFGRVYAAYGGIFIIMALIWGWKADGFQPDKWDVIGALIALTGACIIIYMPRNS